MSKYPGFDDSCVYSPAKDPAPPKSRLQGDSGPTHNGQLYRDSNHTTSRGGNTSAPGGKIMPPKTPPKGTPGRGQNAESIGRD